MTRPLHAVTEALGRIAAGRVDLDSKLRVRVRDEIAEAATSSRCCCTASADRKAPRGSPRRCSPGTRHPYVLGAHSVLVTTSIGICLFPADGDDPDTVMRHADRAMYHIKEQGRSGYRFFASMLSARAAAEAAPRAIR